LVVDAGANEGQTTFALTNVIPKAQIHCFEPNSIAFERLEKLVGARVGIQINRLALGADERMATLFHQKISQKTSLVEELNQNCGFSNDVKVVRLDDYCRSKAISRINLLKTDTEGFDLQVIRGCEELLIAKNVDLVLSEVGVHIDDLRHTSFSKVTSYLELRGLFLYGLYDFPDRECDRDAEYFNALFVREGFVEHSP